MSHSSKALSNVSSCSLGPLTYVFPEETHVRTVFSENVRTGARRTASLSAWRQAHSRAAFLESPARKIYTPSTPSLGNMKSPSAVYMLL